MSQEALASQLGITFQQVQKYERGANRIAAATLVGISNAIDMPVCGLMDQPKRRASASEIDAPNVQKVLAAAIMLNDEGREVLLSLARALTTNAKFKASGP